MYQDLQINRLRALVTIHDLGGFRRAADELCVTQPAVSQQIRQLSRFIKAPVFTSTARELQLSPAGEELLGYARRILALNDEIVTRFAPPPVGSVRLAIGIADQLAEALPHVLKHLSSAIPSAQIRVRTGLSELLQNEIDTGQLDVALLLRPEGNSRNDTGYQLGRLHLDWFGQPSADDEGEVIPLTLFTEPCSLRSRIVDALDASNVLWRIAYEGAELVGLRAAVKAGLGVTCLIANSDTLWGLPRTTALPLPEPPEPVPVTLTVARTVVTRRFITATKEALYDALDGYPFAA